MGGSSVGSSCFTADNRALLQKAPKSLDLLLGLDLQPLPIDEAILERRIARALYHLTGELGLLAQHTNRDIHTLLDPFGLRFQQPKRCPI